MAVMVMSVHCPAAEVVWFDGSKAVTYSVQRGVEPVVMMALDMFCGDMETVTGRRAEADVANKATVRIVGANGRGAAYGLLELSRMAGVSPWIWWGDVVPERRARLTIDSGFRTLQGASVEYRGIFINDEDWSLRPWSCGTFEPSDAGQIGPQTYKRVFQLLLRLRANAIWPAMHEGTRAFFLTAGAKAVADSCGIAIGTSHCEPLLRNNVGEWDVRQRGRFNYITNRQAVQDYWAATTHSL